MAGLLEAPGNIVVIGGARAKARLRAAEGAIDDWTYELVDRTAHLSGDALRAHAPGAIDRLVEVTPAREIAPAHFESIAGVRPDTFYRKTGQGSDSSDYPIFVDQGTGLFGEIRKAITRIPPGSLMGPFWYKGRRTFVSSFKGQKPQRFSRAAFIDATSATPGNIHVALPDLQRKLET